MTTAAIVTTIAITITTETERTAGVRRKAHPTADRGAGAASEAAPMLSHDVPERL